MLLIRRPPCYRSLHVKVIGPTPDLKLIQRNHRCCIKCRWEFVAMTSIRGFVHWQMVDKKRWRNEGEPLDFPWCQIWCGILPQMERWAAQVALLGWDRTWQSEDGQNMSSSGSSDETKKRVNITNLLHFGGRQTEHLIWKMPLDDVLQFLLPQRGWLNIRTSLKEVGTSKWGDDWTTGSVQWNQPGYVWSTGIR